ncbi:MAG: hypothetical protein JWP37_3034 [Mucilaginibacter sp.]|nr:hypothetical protein [Mucilaginibacter sp.]
MKKLLLITTLLGLALTACTDTKKQEKDLLDDLLKVHDKVMGNDEALMKNKMQLDSLLKLPAKDTAEKVNMKAMDTKLLAAEEAMETWMHKFEPDVTGKSHDDIMKYYDSQKKEIMSVDSQMNVAITESNKYLSNKSK